jgi:uncharacterized YccA/Bax inhibitor family protein
MRSTNPVFSRGLFRRDAGSDGAARQPQPATIGTATANPIDWDGKTDTSAGRAAMTIDDVVVRSAATFGMVVLTATLSWSLLPVDSTGIGRSFGIGVAAALVAFVLSPREQSWFAAFGLVTTLVWIYLEALQVLSILQRDD